MRYAVSVLLICLLLQGCATNKNKLALVKQEVLTGEWCISLEEIKESNIENEFIVSCFRARATIKINCKNILIKSCTAETKNGSILMWSD